ncbi:hypothetical protein [Yoonia sp. I 8.24]|uniref:hypothetical protein n=1 Tax=Yoonia sp. I 8.24 TaxID=1537229 RepID=UPI001EDFFCEE|nr:hypothetical protein [Yoonia sp. I 8.24]MCG3268550.1 hypothetical protein [Yoonia sp. I 8.24]
MAITTPSNAPGQGALAPNALGRMGYADMIAAMLWVVSSQGYYLIKDSFAFEAGYDSAPILFTAYYLAWSAIALWSFRSLIAESVNPNTMTREAVILVSILGCFALFVIYGLPLLPNVSELRAPSEPPDFMFASAWYYLPKSAEILFQQVLAAAIILTAGRAGYRLSTITLGMALAFGSFHLLLAFDGFTPTYVTRFTISATAFGALLPYLYLRANSGFRWAYSLHWGFYAVDAVLTHFILAAPPWA